MDLNKQKVYEIYRYIDFMQEKITTNKITISNIENDIRNSNQVIDLLKEQCNQLLQKSVTQYQTDFTSLPSIPLD